MPRSKNALFVQANRAFHLLDALKHIEGLGSRLAFRGTTSAQETGFFAVP
jgi:hypothetical protein